MACKEQLERLETKEMSDHKDPRDCREQLVSLVLLDRAGLRAPLALPGQPGQRAQVARRDP